MSTGWEGSRVMKQQVNRYFVLFYSNYFLSQGDDDLKDTGFHLTTTNQGASAAGPGFSLKF